jgi:hypothetical protein
MIEDGQALIVNLSRFPKDLIATGGQRFDARERRFRAGDSAEFDLVGIEPRRAVQILRAADLASSAASISSLRYKRSSRQILKLRTGACRGPCDAIDEVFLLRVAADTNRPGSQNAFIGIECISPKRGRRIPRFVRSKKPPRRMLARRLCFKPTRKPNRLPTRQFARLGKKTTTPDVSERGYAV